MQPETHRARYITEFKPASWSCRSGSDQGMSVGTHTARATVLSTGPRPGHRKSAVGASAGQGDCRIQINPRLAGLACPAGMHEEKSKMRLAMTRIVAGNAAWSLLVYLLPAAALPLTKL